MPASRKKAINVILAATFIAGTLDILAAILVYSIVLEQTSPSMILMSIASGVFGKAAFSGGSLMVLAGLLLHYLIAFLFSTFYYIIYPGLEFLKKQRLISGILYGIFVWLVMNLGVLRIVFSAKLPSDPEAALLGISILIIAFGIPISYIISTSRN
ncbi:DUF1440 domain-containing protein [Dyadobacter aurulentus]|uniref:DUF1440 domain-containing protein n=1 Tax=Dyadobacter sp. UC 10 TaxID=2605428 RepID=UPI0011F210A7|nr:DUF1440 domain-containing protein [Dyadobacter sp. UC 10]KAA0993292.1 DUF1440 domain-containing protein [Dyadobacter sp. UC 10]